MRFVLLCALAAALTASPVRAQYPAVDSVAGPLAEPETDEEANHAPDPNRVPYETETNLGERALALPSTLWNGVAYVVRSAVLYAEYSGTLESVQSRYLGPEPPPVIVLPTFSAGGRDGLTVGAMVYTNGVLGEDRRARFGGRYGSPETFGVSARFTDASLFGFAVGLRLGGGYWSDGDEQFYTIGNDDDDDDDRIEYAYRESRFGAELRLPVAPRIGLTVDGEFKHFEVRDEEEGEPFPTSVPGFGGADFLSAGAFLRLDFSQGGGLYAPRTYQGTELLLGVRYGTDTSTSPASGSLRYLRTSAELRQFVPVPFLPFDRRLALRARIERTNAPGDAVVPFYELSTLGDPSGLRGYPFDRFRDRGSLLLTAEYRYPIFNIFDAVLFVDAGQVFDQVDDLAFDRFHTDFGGGFRVYGGENVAARLEVAFTPEGSPRVIAQVGTTF